MPLEPVSLVEGTEVDVAVPTEQKTSTTATLLAIMERRPPIDPSIVDELERAIESGKIPARARGCFDDLDDRR